MTLLSYTVPVAGTDLNSVAAPEISTALNAIKTWAGGEIDTSNLSPTAGITVAQLALGVMTLTPRMTASNVNANSGDLVVPTSVPLTVVLPAPVAGVVVAVVAPGGATAAAQVTIDAHSGETIYTPGGLTTTSVVLGTAAVAWMGVADGTNWRTISGQQDTGRVPLTAIGTTGSPCAQQVGNRVFLSGEMVPGVSVPAGTAIGTLPSSSMYPAVRPRLFNALQSLAGLVVLTVATSGALFSSQNMASVEGLTIDGFDFPV